MITHKGGSRGLSKQNYRCNISCVFLLQVSDSQKIKFSLHLVVSFFFFNDKVERFHRATLFHISEGDVVPDNFLPVSLLVKWEKLKDFELRRRMHVVDRTNFLKKLKFTFINAEVLKADEVSV